MLVKLLEWHTTVFLQSMIIFCIEYTSTVKYTTRAHYIALFFYVMWCNMYYTWSYDFHDGENADGIVESSHKSGIYCIMQNVTEFVKFIQINKK